MKAAILTFFLATSLSPGSNWFKNLLPGAFGPGTDDPEVSKIVDNHLTSQTALFRFESCDNSQAEKACEFSAVPIQTGGDGECGQHIVVTERVFTPEGAVKYAHVAPMALTPRAIIVDGEAREIRSRLRPTVFASISLYDEPGLKDICLGGRIKSDELVYELGDVPERRATFVAGIVGPSQESPFRSYFGKIGCLITGCEERQALSVTVRGGENSLPIMFDGSATTLYTNDTISVPRGQLSKLSVLYSDGSQRRVPDCRKVRSRRWSAVYNCAPVR